MKEMLNGKGKDVTNPKENGQKKEKSKNGK